jgi:hypothetical protein
LALRAVFLGELELWERSVRVVRAEVDVAVVEDTMAAAAVEAEAAGAEI